MQWSRWPTPGLFTCLIWDWLLLLGMFVHAEIELSAFSSKTAIPVPVGDHLKQIPLFIFVLLSFLFLSRYQRLSQIQSVSVPWKVCARLQEQTQCAAQSNSQDFWSGWFGAILQGSLCPCQCCASLIRLLLLSGIFVLLPRDRQGPNSAQLWGNFADLPRALQDAQKLIPTHLLAD